MNEKDFGLEGLREQINSFSLSCTLKLNGNLEQSEKTETMCSYNVPWRVDLQSVEVYQKAECNQRTKIQK